MNLSEMKNEVYSVINGETIPTMDNTYRVMLGIQLKMEMEIKKLKEENSKTNTVSILVRLI